VNTIINKKTRN